MQTLLAWILVGLILPAGVGWAGWILDSRLSDDTTLALRFTTGLAFSIGALTLLMMWEGLLNIRYTTVGVAVPFFALMLPGWLLWLRNKSGPMSLTLPTMHTIRQQPMRWSIILLTSIISVAILFNAAYWPFSRDDTLGIYDFYGQQMTSDRTLPELTGADSLYRTYPMAIPLTYTFVYLVSGWHNEYLARVIPALLSIGTLPAVYVLGCSLFGKRTGYLSALLLAVTPTFASWASVGYVDLPMAFFYTLSAIFAWRVWQHGDTIDTLLAGLMIGLAAWTKNAALLGIIFLAGWLLWAWLWRRIPFTRGMLGLSLAGIVAAPWYVRNLIGAGFIIPSTAWTQQAQQSFENLFIFITRPQNFSAVGWLILIGIGVGSYHLARQRLNAPEYALLLLWSMPFFIAWWLYVSYDPRFLLLFLPILIVLAASWMDQLWEQTPTVWQRRFFVPIALLVLLLVAQVTWDSVEFKDEILRNPFMDDATKHAIVLSVR